MEWWILGHAHWLVSGGYTAYSTTAGALGLGPLGVMERVDVVHGQGHVLRVFRRDFNAVGCPTVGAVNRRHAKKCPNDPAKSTRGAEL